MSRAFNHYVAGAMFERRFGRWPLPAHDPRSLINDVIFARMIDPAWSALHRAFVDKETAKIEAARLCPGIRIAETLMVVPMDNVSSAAHLFDILRPFAGMNAIAKPAHASGAVTFLRDLSRSDQLHFLHALAAIDYATILREMQYQELPKKIIVEAMVPTATGALPDDYKFHCVDGEPLLCQIDHGRFGQAWNRLYRVPGFEPMHPADGLRPPEGFVPIAPERMAAMTAAARALSAPFDFVRVDLYDGIDGIYFGELTFTPAASLGIAPSAAGDDRETETHRIYSSIMMDALNRVKAAGTVAPGPCDGDGCRG